MKPNPEGQREVVLEMIFELVESLLPEHDKAMPIDAEHRIEEIHRALSYALGLPIEDH